MFTNFQSRFKPVQIKKLVFFYLLTAMMCGLGLAASPLKSARAAGTVSDCNNYYTQLAPMVAGGGLVTIGCTTELFVPETIDIKQDTIIDGGNLHADPGVRLFHVYPGKTLTLKNIDLRSGFTNSGGGTIYSDNANVYLQNTVIEYSTAAYGGGVYMNGGFISSVDSAIGYGKASYGGAIFGHNAVIQLKNTKIAANNALADGGGILTDGGSLTVEGGSFYGNTATRSGGGLMTNWAGGNVAKILVNNVTFQQNTASNGGAIASENGNGESNVVMIMNSTFVKNKVSGRDLPATAEQSIRIAVTS